MQDKNPNNQPYSPSFSPMDSFDRRLNDRRKHTCEGYTYISMVGWICRRERRRRSCDCRDSSRFGINTRVD